MVLGSQCAAPKEASLGANWASGVVDEYFVYRASGYSSERAAEALVGADYRERPDFWRVT